MPDACGAIWSRSCVADAPPPTTTTCCPAKSSAARKSCVWSWRPRNVSIPG
ncbi:Uncharacterised protein [Mycobacteroides abscessus]|nr:Uncharacterised protein [Mycobacteroides abscessus]